MLAPLTLRRVIHEHYNSDNPPCVGGVNQMMAYYREKGWEDDHPVDLTLLALEMAPFLDMSKDGDIRFCHVMWAIQHLAEDSDELDAWISTFNPEGISRRNIWYSRDPEYQAEDLLRAYPC